MMKLSPAAERGRTKISWLDSRHTFSFGEWYDPAHMGFRALRVINDDRVAAGGGFPTHGHADMEIVSYVLEGALEHKDSIGTGSVIRPGDVQRMSAGTGVRHSEFNASRTEPVHFLQIWILPDRPGHAPGYEQKAFSEADRQGRLRLVASPDGRDGSVTLHQDVALYVGLLDEGQQAKLELAAGRHAWVHVARGAATVNGQRLGEGDGAALSDERALTIDGHGGEVLVFDLG
jgi:redox-sensitive bicupin YhaK (pirin superfamily)